MVNQMTNTSPKKEDSKTLYEQEVYMDSENSENDKDILSSFQTLKADEARIVEQKEHLTVLLNKLEIKAKEEVERRKQNVERLNIEVEDLKRKCERIANFINSQ
jgi:hypothetical protein